MEPLGNKASTRGAAAARGLHTDLLEPGPRIHPLEGGVQLVSLVLLHGWHTAQCSRPKLAPAAAGRRERAGGFVGKPGRS
jgi:hypothetical protein